MKVRAKDVEPGDVILGPSWGDPGRVMRRESSRQYRGDVHLYVSAQNGRTIRRRLPGDALVDRLPPSVRRPRFCPSCGCPLYGAAAVVTERAGLYGVVCSHCGWGGSIDAEGEPGNRRPCIYVSGPLSNGGTAGAEQEERNVRAAISAADRLLAAGWAPFVPHLNLAWHRIFPHSHTEWLDFDFAWLPRCDALLRLPGASVGADREVAWCLENGTPVFRTVRAAAQVRV